jgi:hypothetical protein
VYRKILLVAKEPSKLQCLTREPAALLFLTHPPLSAHFYDNFKLRKDIFTHKREFRDFLFIGEQSLGVDLAREDEPLIGANRCIGEK